MISRNVCFLLILDRPNSQEELSLIYEQLPPSLLQSIGYLRQLCNLPNFNREFSFWPVAFFMRLVCRKFSFAELSLLLRTPQLRFLKESFDATWMDESASEGTITGEDGEMIVRFDNYLVHGMHYADVRALWQTFFVQASTDMHAFSQSMSGALDSQSDPRMQSLVTFLALHKASLQHANSADLVRGKRAQLMELLAGILSSGGAENTGQLVSWFLDAAIGQRTLTAADQTDVALQELVLHYRLVTRMLMSHSSGGNLLLPFCLLAHDPARLGMGVYLPTMPSDDLFQVVGSQGERLHYYYCTNGHPYAVGNCGNPEETAKCPTCAVPIGKGIVTRDKDAVKGYLPIVNNLIFAISLFCHTLTSC